MDQPTVLIVSDDADFVHAVTARWQSERKVPAFTLMKGDLCHEMDLDAFQLAILGGTVATAAALQALDPVAKPVILVCPDRRQAQAAREHQPRLLVVQQHEGWLDALVLLASEALRRCEASARAARAEQSNAMLERQATLGRYMLEMRHTMNNALTSVLGNSELLLLEPGSLSSTARSQMDTIRNMAMRMHEILQRLSSIEKELSVVEKQAQKERGVTSQAAGVS